ncbi:MAG: GNAT family N-acetyltransferase [Maricaulaceae bacterium]|jgi:CelD/BcsL family acetyltransferase involved in cellulose biosynthesis
MRIDVIATKELGGPEELVWRRYQAIEKTIALPALSPGWARCVGLARPDARIAVIGDDAGRPEGFLPIQAGGRGFVEPLGSSLKLGSGLIGDPQLEWGATRWLADLRAKAMPFESVPDRQVEFARAARGEVTRMSAELYGGAGAYLEAKRRDDYDVLEMRARRVEKIRAALGRTRVKLFSCEGPDFTQTLYWSAGAYRQPQEDWEIAALRAAFEHDGADGFGGALFTMHADETLIAGAFFLVGERVAQLAFYGESPEAEAFEPARVLIADAIAAFAARGLDEVDFGVIEGRLAREFATRRRQRLYGMIRPEGSKSGITAALNPRVRRARRAGRDLGTMAGA